MSTVIKTRIRPRRTDTGTADVFQAAALKVVAELAHDIVDLTGPELMGAYGLKQIRYEELRRRFEPMPPYIDRSTTNEELGQIIATMIVAALDEARV